MKLLLYGINYAPELTGIGKYTGEMAEWLQSRGHKVTVVTAPPHYPSWRIAFPYRGWAYARETMGGVRVLRCPLYVPRKLSALKRILHLLSFAVTSFPVLLREAWRDRPEIILIVEPPFLCLPAAGVVAWFVRAKSWLHIQDFELDAAFELNQLRGHWLKQRLLAVERFLLRHTDKVSTISDHMLRQLDAKHVEPEKQFLFPNWVDTNKIYPMGPPNVFRQGLGLTDQTVALYSGNMGRKQGLEMILESARRLANDGDVHFVLAGDGSMKPLLVAMAQGMQNVHFLDLQPIEKLNELLNLADIHLLIQRPSSSSSFMPSKLTTILANGRPIIAAAETGSPVAEIVQHCGCVVSPGNSEELANAIIRLSRNAGERDDLGRAGRAYAIQHLRKDAILKQFERGLLNLVGKVADPR